MLQLTFERASRLVGAESVFLVGNARHGALYREQLPQLSANNLILEPEGRGTAPAVALAAVACSHLASGAAVATIPSDHVIAEPDEWLDGVGRGLAFAATNDRIVCLGTSPQSGETKFGYMVAGKRLGGDDEHPIREVERFVEKPDRESLEALIATGNCLRNMGTLMFRPDVLVGEMEKIIPEIINPIADAFTVSDDRLAGAYRELPVDSIDQALLQRSRRIGVVSGEIISSDAGDFATLGDAIGRDEQGNAFAGTVVSVDAGGNTVFAENVTVALVGVSEMVVVVEGDRILVCPADETQRIKEIQRND